MTGYQQDTTQTPNGSTPSPTWPNLMMTTYLLLRESIFDDIISLLILGYGEQNIQDFVTIGGGNAANKEKADMKK